MTDDELRERAREILVDELRSESPSVWSYPSATLDAMLRFAAEERERLAYRLATAPLHPPESASGAIAPVTPDASTPYHEMQRIRRDARAAFEALDARLLDEMDKVWLLLSAKEPRP